MRMGKTANFGKPLPRCKDHSFRQTASSVAILDRVVGPGYDWRIRPSKPLTARYASNHEYTRLPYLAGARGPTKVGVNIYIRRLKLVDQVMEIELTFRQAWNDTRLSYSREFGRDAPKFINIHPLEKADRRLWSPDTFFQNAYDIETQSIPNPTELTRLYSDGGVLTSQK